MCCFFILQCLHRLGTCDCFTVLWGGLACPSTCDFAGRGENSGVTKGNQCVQGVEAQTLANVYIALENELEIIPVLNKIDLPGALVWRTLLVLDTRHHGVG